MLAFLLAPFYLLFNLYLFRRIMGWVRAWFPWFRKRKHWAVPAALYAFFALSFVLAFPLPAGRLKRALMLIGNYWLGVLLYLLLAVLLADGLRLLLVHGLKLRSLRSARMHRMTLCASSTAASVESRGKLVRTIFRTRAMGLGPKSRSHSPRRFAEISSNMSIPSTSNSRVVSSIIAKRCAGSRSFGLLQPAVPVASCALKSTSRQSR